MNSEKIYVEKHITQFGNFIIKSEYNNIIGYINHKKDGKYHISIESTFDFKPQIFANKLANFGIILTESINLKDLFGNYLYKCVTNNNIPTNINTILTPFNKNGSTLKTFVNSLKPYYLFIGTILINNNGFKINSDGIYNYCIKNELFNKHDKPNVLQFWQLLFDSFNLSDFEKLIIETQETPVEETQETPVEETQETVVEETQETVVEETQDTPVEETQDTPVEETQETVVEETQETVVEETQDTPVEETQETVVEETQETVVEETQETVVEETLQQKFKIVKLKPNFLKKIKKTQLNNIECNLLIRISEITGNSWASHILGVSIQYSNKTQQIIDAINIIQKILISYNQQDFNITQVVFNKYY